MCRLPLEPERRLGSILKEWPGTGAPAAEGGRMSHIAASPWPGIAATLGAIGGTLAFPVRVMAQLFSPGFPDTGEAFDWAIAIRIGIIIVSAIAVFVLGYFVVYPTVLRRENARVWPVTLFGRCTAGAWFFAWTIALAALWRELAFENEFGQSFWSEYGARIGMVLVAVLGAAACLLLWQSSVPKEVETTSLASTETKATNR